MLTLFSCSKAFLKCSRNSPGVNRVLYIELKKRMINGSIIILYSPYLTYLITRSVLDDSSIICSEHYPSVHGQNFVIIIPYLENVTISFLSRQLSTEVTAYIGDK